MLNRRYKTQWDESNKKYVLIDSKDNKEYDSILCCRDLLNYQQKKINNLEREKQSWKHLALSNSEENDILFNEIGICIEQGYRTSDAYQEFWANKTQRNRRLVKTLINTITKKR